MALLEKVKHGKVIQVKGQYTLHTHTSIFAAVLE